MKERGSPTREERTTSSRASSALRKSVGGRALSLPVSDDLYCSSTGRSESSARAFYRRFRGRKRLFFDRDLILGRERRVLRITRAPVARSISSAGSLRGPVINRGTHLSGEAITHSNYAYRWFPSRVYVSLLRHQKNAGRECVCVCVYSCERAKRMDERMNKRACAGSINVGRIKKSRFRTEDSDMYDRGILFLTVFIRYLRCVAQRNLSGESSRSSIKSFHETSVCT